MGKENYYFNLQSFKPYIFTDKEKCVNKYCFDMLNRIQSMFKYSGDIPETLKMEYFDTYLFTFGHCCITEVNGDLYAMFGNWGGEPGPYYVPTEYIVANPYLKFNKTLKIDKDCIVARNDRYAYGIKDIFEKHATMLVENDISRFIAEYNTRIADLLAAEDDKTKKSAELFLQRIIEGKLGVIASNAMLDSFKAYRQTSGSVGSTLTTLIEHHQYIKSEWLQDLGIDSNWNGKREAVNSAETALNQDYLMPLVDDMLDERKKALERVEKLYGVKINVEFNSSWEDNQKEIDQELEEKKDPEEVKNDDNTDSEAEG